MAKIITMGAILLHTACAAAVPGNLLPVYPEFIPGPGLPSLSSLGITSNELYKRESDAGSVNGLTKRFDNYCGGARGAANVDHVIACFNYLTRLGTTPCSVPADGKVHNLCSAGTAGIAGVNPTNHGTTSFCSDVALGVQWVFTYCNSGGQVEGIAATNGNGDLIVVVEGQNRGITLTKTGRGPKKPTKD